MDIDEAAAHQLISVRSGDFNINNSKFWSVGQEGYYWSSRSRTDKGYTYGLYFYNAAASPTYDYNRYHGFPLRCLVR